jgi:tetratricopeptide (TPR) repeat protein/glycosyltransferase involved in cell wall biosynthesis
VTLLPKNAGYDFPMIPLENSFVVVMGMHRSGTSALSRTLNLLGLDMPRNLIPPNVFNRPGYWESETIVNFNDLLLQRQDRHWSDPKVLHDSWQDMTTFQTDSQEAVRILQGVLDRSSGVVVKDPRMSRTFPIWRHAIESMNVTPICLIGCRHPLEVSQSLERRNGMTREHALKLWQSYMLDAERCTRGMRRAVVHYDHLLKDWRAELGRAFGACGADFDISRCINQEKIDAYVSVGNRNHDNAADTLSEYEAETRGVAALFDLYKSNDLDQHQNDLDRLTADWQTDWAAHSPGRAHSDYPQTIAAWHWESSKSHAAAGHQTAALEAARKATILDPGKSGYWYALGKRLQAIKHPKRAAKAFGEAVRLDETVSVYHEALADTLLALGRSNQAHAAVKAAIALAPDQAELYFLAGKILRTKKLDGRAIAAYRHAILLHDGVARYHFALGNALLGSGDRAAAATSFNNALRFDPKDVNPVMALGTLYRNNGQLPAAEKMFRRALTLHQDRPLVTSVLADVLHRLGQNDDAIAVIEETLRSETGPEYLYDLWGRILAMQGRLDEAETAFNMCAKLDQKAFTVPQGVNAPVDIALRALKDLCATRPIGDIRQQQCRRVLSGLGADWWAHDLSRILKEPKIASLPDLDRWPVGERRAEYGYVPIAQRPSNTDTCSISIMIPVYEVGRESWLRGCIESILEQDRGADWGEIVVVDDCSPSGNVAGIVKDYEPRVKYVRNDANLGLIGNHNRCIEIARGDFVHFVHQDDRVEPGFYDAVLDPMIARDDLVAAFSGWQSIDEDDQLAGHWPSETTQPAVLPNPVQALGLYSWMTFPSIIVRRSSYETVGGFSPSFPFIFDVDMWSRLAVLGNVWSEPRSLARFRQHKGSATHRFSEFERLTDRMRVRERTLSHLPQDVHYATARATFRVLFQVSWRSLMDGSTDLGNEDIVRTIALLTQGWASAEQQREMENLILEKRTAG